MTEVLRKALALHPDSRCPAVTRIDVVIRRPNPAMLALEFAVTGRIGALRLPPAAAPERTDELWRHSCFEAFIRPLPGDVYYELNFAPSTRWAVYRFDRYRSGMSAVSESGVPLIETHTGVAGYQLLASLDVAQVPGLRDGAPWRLGLSAVIEEASGRLSYWALAHHPGKADFHHSDCFTIELPGAWHT